MGANNLRIIYQNAVDLPSTALTASSVLNSITTPVTNLTLDAKGKVWRSTAATTTATLTAVFTSATTVGAVILPFCNLSATATLTVTVFSANNFTGTSTVAGPTLCSPYQSLSLWDWATTASGVNTYAFGGGTYARLWIPSQPSGLSVRIVITDTSNVVGYLEASRLIIGPYWSPTYNTTYGMSATFKDTTVSERTESGDLISNRGIRYNTLSFTLPYIINTERVQLSKMLRGNGSAKAVFISLFPDNSADWEKEQAHQIYGKMLQLPSLSLPILDYYATQIDIEEV
jgi:hypothetical protein